MISTFAFAPQGFQSLRMAIPLWLREKLFQKRLLRDELKVFSPDFDWENRLLFGEHHQSHAASAFLRRHSTKRGEPIVPEDAFRCFMGTEIDMLVAENCFLHKEDQNPALKINYNDAFGSHRRRY